MHPERIQLLGDRNLLFAPEDDGGLLLAIAQRHVVDLDVFPELIALGHLGEVVPGADKPFVRLPGRLHISSELDSLRVAGLSPLHCVVQRRGSQ
jgi:hypothetical protein